MTCVTVIPVDTLYRLEMLTRVGGGEVRTAGLASLLLLAQSARILAKSARRGGWLPTSVDFYGDEDTCRFSADCRQIETDLRNGSDRSIMDVVLATASKGEALIVGSGFDGKPGIIERLAKDYLLYGNDAETCRAVRRPARFFPLLDRLQIPYPAVRYTKPKEPWGWLLKDGYSEGGRGVRLAGKADSETGKHCYYQRQLQGQPASVLFLADGEKHRIIGFNSQWTSSVDQAYPYQFEGIGNWVDLPVDRQERLDCDIRRLVQAIPLKGLNSLDFIFNGTRYFVLEINPRPSASMALYDDEFPSGLVDAHVRACQGDLTSSRRGFSNIKAMSIVYPPKPITVPYDMEWPGWSADRPKGGTLIPAFQPLCSVSAQGEQRHEVMRKLQFRKTEVTYRFGGNDYRGKKTNALEPIPTGSML